MFETIDRSIIFHKLRKCFAGIWTGDCSSWSFGRRLWITSFTKIASAFPVRRPTRLRIWPLDQRTFIDWLFNTCQWTAGAHFSDLIFWPTVSKLELGPRRRHVIGNFRIRQMTCVWEGFVSAGFH